MKLRPGSLMVTSDTRRWVAIVISAHGSEHNKVKMTTLLAEDGRVAQGPGDMFWWESAFKRST